MINNIKKYNQKRNFTKTSEPVGKKEKTTEKLRFVVQHHLARKDHYDFRLEWQGTMKSWAVPKGPSYYIKDKRLAVRVEDHPIAYRNFEGVIPKGEYGGGTVMIWDEGFWIPEHNPTQGLKNGLIKFELKGKRLCGKWSLVRFKETNWLLIKEIDAMVDYTDISLYTTSIRTGRTMLEIEDGLKKKDVSNIVGAVQVTNPLKVICRRPNVKKIDIAMYYEKILPRMYPYIKNRLISTIRCPDGETGECFFKKHFETNSIGLGMVQLVSDKDKRTDYYYIKDCNGLLQEVQMNGFEFHMWGCNAKNINQPNMMVFDLDPDEGLSLHKVRQGVKDLKSILDELGLVSFLKTSGGKGYHVVVPIHSIKTWKDFRDVSKNIAMLMETRWPDKYVSNMKKNERKNKIFIDWMRNIKGATSVAPYSVRIRKKATVSMPISWKELDTIKPNEITMELAIKRLRRKDPWENYFDVIQ